MGQLFAAIAIAFLIGGGCVLFVSRRISRIADHGVTPGSRKVAGSARAKGKQAKVKAGDSVKAIKAHHFSKVKAKAWLEGKRRRWARADQRRENGTHVSQWPGIGARGVRNGVSAGRRRLRRSQVPAEGVAFDPMPGNSPAPPPPATGTPPSPNGHGPQQTTSQTAPPASTNGRAPEPMTTSTTGSTGSDLFTAAQHVVGSSLSGGMQSKRRGIHTINEALQYLGGLLQQFGTRLGEADQGYPAAVWEPILTAAAHVTAAGASAGEADSALASLASTPLGEVAGSSVKSPHHEQVNSE